MWATGTGRVGSVVGLVLVCLVVGSAPVGAALAPAAAPAQQRPPGILTQQGVDTDSVRLIVDINENGSASWTVQYWTRLDDDNTTAAFESLQSDIESNPDNYTSRFARRMQATVDAAENSTGREMNATGFSVEAETRAPPQYGVIVYSFQWDGFAAVEGETIRAGDAIEGLFLDEKTRLVFQWPSTYSMSEVTPEPDEQRANAVVWRGAETSFVSGEPRLVVTAGGGAAGTPTPAPDGDGEGGLPVTLIVGGLFALGVASVVAWRRRDDIRALVSGGAPETTTPQPAEPEAAGAGGGAEAKTGAKTAEAEPESEPEPRPELLSNEERVLKFVEEQGGRVKQQEIVQAFDWTEARTSQIVRDLRDEGKLEGFRLGRENVLKLPDGEDDESASDADEN